MSQKILDSVTGPGPGRTFTKARGGPPGTVFMRRDDPPGDLTGGDNASIQISHDKGVSWVDMKREGSVLSLSAETNHESVYGPGLYRLNVTAAGGALSAYYD